jgi:hypothetical protein
MKLKTIYLAILFILMILVIITGVFYSIPLNVNKTNTNPVHVSLNTSFQVKINQTAIIEPSNINITFLNITEDSRCPEGAVCVWPGQVKALFRLDTPQTRGNLFNLTLNSNETQSEKNITGYSVKLFSIDPYPESSKSTSINGYVATLSIKTIDSNK